MKCNGCGTHMLLDREESTDIASTCWHRCPLCSKVRLTSALNSSLEGKLLTRADAENDLGQDLVQGTVAVTSANNEFVQPIASDYTSSDHQP